MTLKLITYPNNIRYKLKLITLMGITKSKSIKLNKMSILRVRILLSIDFNKNH